jgi:hypothetical protein
MRAFARSSKKRPDGRRIQRARRAAQSSSVSSRSVTGTAAACLALNALASSFSPLGDLTSPGLLALLQLGASLDRHDLPTLRLAVEMIEKAAGKVEVRGGRVAVSLPPGEVTVAAFGGERPGSRAARVCYLAEADLVATRRGDGHIAAEKVPAEPVLPSGRLAQ